jgi:exopolyphosphatase/guanosine-5'-triphosphate,3'-diphosphate pyrophosphatase
MDLERYIHLFRSSLMEEIRTLPGMEPRRADVIEAGATLFHTFMELAEMEEISVSPRGLRHGLLLVDGAKQPL